MARNSLGRIKDLTRRMSYAARGKKESKKDRRVRRYMDDGKISKKEAKKLKKRGISQSDVQRRYDKDFKAAKKLHGTGGQSYRFANPDKVPRYEPLLYSRGASSQFARGIEPSRKKRRRAPQPRRASTGRDTSDFQLQIDDDYARFEQMMIAEAEERRRQQAEADRQFRAQQQNIYSAGLQPSIQLQGAGTIPKLGAAEQFRRRIGSQFGTAYQGVAI